MLRQPVKAVRKSLENGPIKASVRSSGGQERASIDWSDLVFLYTERALREYLTPRARTELYGVL